MRQHACTGVVQVIEIGDGNLNYVWMVEGPAGAVVFKQGPPHLKADPNVPLTQVLPRKCNKKEGYDDVRGERL